MGADLDTLVPDRKSSIAGWGRQDDCCCGTSDRRKGATDGSGKSAHQERASRNRRPLLTREQRKHRLASTVNETQSYSSRYGAEARFLDISRHSPAFPSCNRDSPQFWPRSQPISNLGGANLLGPNSNRSMLPFCEPSHLLRTTLLVICAVLAAGTAGAQEPAAPSRAQVYRRVEALTALGRRMFLDPSLSASGKMSCASCHSPLDAFGPPNSLPVQRGGQDLQQSGIRAAPSLKYLQVTPQFTEHFFDSDDAADDSVDNGPTGGLTWDGRVDRGRDQARIPLLSPFEMANQDPAGFAARLCRAAYADEFRPIFGDTVLAEPDQAFEAALEAFEVYEQSYAEFYPYSSKYDAYLAGKAELTAQERRGLSLFEDPAKGDCARCHVSAPGKDGTPPQFTDYGLVAIGAPRNTTIPANKDPSFFDLGLCGPLRSDLRDRAEYCGRFKTPS